MTGLSRFDRNVKRRFCERRARMDRDEFTRRILAMRLTLYRVSYGILASESEREDAVQNAVMKAWQKHGQLRDERLMETWLVRILINECYNVKRAHRRISPMAELPERPAPADAGGEVRGAVLALPDKLRLPVVLHYMEGYRVDEIARMLHLPQGTVKSRLRNARARLKEMLGEKGDVDDA